MFNKTKLKELRIKKDYTQQELATLCNLSNKASISSYENGTERPSLESLVALAKVLDTTTDYLLDIEEKIIIKENVDENKKERYTALSNVDLNIINEIKNHTKLYEQLKLNTKETIKFIENRFF